MFRCQVSNRLSEARCEESLREEQSFQRNMLRLVGLPYRYGGRGYGGIDCSSLIVRGIRDVLGLRVSQLPWMTADQLGKGHHESTVPALSDIHHRSCILVFFDWDKDGIYEHAAVKIFDGTWIWSSSSVGRVVHVNPATETTLRRQWREIEGALEGRCSVTRLANWQALRRLR